MSDPKDEKKSQPQQPAAGDQKRSGRISRDARGNAVWEWEMETGVFGRDVSTQRLKKLEAHELAILETGAHDARSPENKSTANSSKPHPSGTAPAGKPAAKTHAMPEKAGGFNPYDSGSPTGGSYSPRTPKPAAEPEKPKRRSIQSIVADQLGKIKKS